MELKILFDCQYNDVVRFALSVRLFILVLSGSVMLYLLVAKL